MGGAFSPYTPKQNPAGDRIQPYGPAAYCPVLLQENGRALLQENKGNINL